MGQNSPPHATILCASLLQVCILNGLDPKVGTS